MCVCTLCVFVHDIVLVLMVHVCVYCICVVCACDTESVCKD